MLQLIIPIVFIGLAIAGCGAKTDLTEEPIIPAQNENNRTCLPNQGERCRQSASKIASGDRFYRNSSLAIGELRNRFPSLPRRLTDTAFAPQDSDVRTFRQINDILVVGGCHAGTTEPIPFLLFYYLTPDGNLNYAHFQDPIFANIGVYIGGYPEDTGSNYHVNVAVPGIDCTELKCVTSMDVINDTLYVADNNNQAIAAYSGFQSRIQEVRNANFCH